MGATAGQLAAADRYWRSIRTAAKRDYAKTYLAARVGGRLRPNRPARLSLAAAHAVERNLDSLLRPSTTNPRRRPSTARRGPARDSKGRFKRRRR